MLHMVRSAREGAWLGLVAGAIFAVVQTLVSVVVWHDGPLTVLRMWASVVVGGAAFGGSHVLAAALVGLPAHLMLSTAFGFVYGLLNGGATAATRRGWARQAAQGAGFGLVLWLVDMQIIARALYPWMLQLPQRGELLLHVVAFGLPLGLMYAATTRRTRLLIVVPRAA